MPLWEALISTRNCQLTRANFWIPVMLFEEVVEMEGMEPYLRGFSWPSALLDYFMDIGPLILGKPCRLESGKNQRSDQWRRSRFTHSWATIECRQREDLEELNLAFEDALNVQEEVEEQAEDTQTDDIGSNSLDRVE